MSLSVCISVYIVGYLVFPFFYSLVDGWPFVSPRVEGAGMFVASLLCMIWPLVALAWLAGIWWCGASWLGVSTRRLCNRLVETLDHVAGHPESEVK